MAARVGAGTYGTSPDADWQIRDLEMLALSPDGMVDRVTIDADSWAQGAVLGLFKFGRAVKTHGQFDGNS